MRIEIYEWIHSMLRAGVIALSLLWPISAATAQQVSTLIDFERFPGPDGVFGTADDIAAPAPCIACLRLTNEFSSMGITFRSGTLFDGAMIPGSTSSNHYISSTPPDATFSRLVTGISITSYSIWSATLYALDENNVVIATDTLMNPNAGTSFFLGTLSVSVNRPIRRFTVLPVGCAIGGPRCDPVLNLDSLHLLAPSLPPPTIVDVGSLPPVPGIPGLSPYGVILLAFLLVAAGMITLRQRN